MGADYRVTKNLVLGATVGYANTTSGLSNGGSLNIDGGQTSVYGTLFNNDFYLDGIIGGGYASLDTMRRTVGGFAHGKGDEANFNGLLGAGYDHHVGAFTLGPIASLQYSEVSIDGFTEHGALGALRIHSQSQDSLQSAVGLKATYSKKVGRFVVTPEVRAEWEHEYLISDSSIDASFGSGSVFTVHGPNIGRDGLLLDAGLAVQVSERVTLFTYYTGELGRENYEVHSVNGGIRVSF